MTGWDRCRQTTTEADTGGTVAGTDNAGRAMFWVLAAVLGYGMLPLVVWFGVRDVSPFMFVACFVCRELRMPGNSPSSSRGASEAETIKGGHRWYRRW